MVQTLLITTLATSAGLESLTTLVARGSGAMYVFDAQREYRGYSTGVRGPPGGTCAIPRLEVAEMRRTKEYAWCCGAGGGVRRPTVTSFVDCEGEAGGG